MVEKVVSELFSTATLPSITPIWVQSAQYRVYGQKRSMSALAMMRLLTTRRRFFAACSNSDVI